REGAGHCRDRPGPGGPGLAARPRGARPPGDRRPGSAHDRGLAGMTNALWYLGRGTGVVSLVLLTVVVALGIASRSGRPAFGLPRFAVSVVHRNASLLAVVLVAIHVTTLLTDPYAQLRLVDVAIAFVGR